MLHHDNLDSIFINTGGSTRNRFGRSNDLRLAVTKCVEYGKQQLKKMPIIETHDFGGLMMLNKFDGRRDFDYQKLFLYDWVYADSFEVNSNNLYFLNYFTVKLILNLIACGLFSGGNLRNRYRCRY